MFGQLVDETRRGRMSRRRFLAAAFALGVGSEDAVREQRRRIVQVPYPRLEATLNERPMSGGTDWYETETGPVLRAAYSAPLFMAFAPGEPGSDAFAAELHASFERHVAEYRDAAAAGALAWREVRGSTEGIEYFVPRS